MPREKNYKLAARLNLFAALCFGFVSYVSFTSNQSTFGYVFAALAFSQIALACLSFSKYQKEKNSGL